LFLAGALAVTYLGFASLALRQAPHFAAVSAGSRRAGPPPALSRRLLYRGSIALLLGAALSFWAEGPSFGSLAWVLLSAGAGVAVTFTLTWRPLWLRWLLPRQLLPREKGGAPRAAGAGAAPRTARWQPPRTR
jgi:hypothetical protein